MRCRRMDNCVHRVSNLRPNYALSVPHPAGSLAKYRRPSSTVVIQSRRNKQAVYGLLGAYIGALRRAHIGEAS